LDTIKVLLVDDHKLVRAGIRVLLQKLAGIEVIAEADNGREALSLISQCQPDIVLMDIAMQEMNGLDTTYRIKQKFSDVKVIILSMYLNEEYILQALRYGTSGYLLKDAAPEELEMAIKSVMDGNTFLSPAVSHCVVADYVQRINESQSGSEQLTSRQREIWQLIAEGFTTKEIAQKLGISVKTVETHRTQLMKKLDIHDLASLVRLAIRIGLITAYE
jgi:DNA-binding NarL/FixJ family response regulator